MVNKMKGLKAFLYFFFLMGIGHALMMVINRVDERYGFEGSFMFWSAIILAILPDLTILTPGKV